MKLPTPPSKYDPVLEAQRNLQLETADLMNLKRRADIELVAPVKLILRSPNGSRYQITVSNSGVLSAVAL